MRPIATLAPDRLDRLEHLEAALPPLGDQRDQDEPTWPQPAPSDQTRPNPPAPPLPPRRRKLTAALGVLILSIAGCQAAPRPIAVSWSLLGSRRAWVSVTVAGKGAPEAWRVQASEVCGVGPLEVKPVGLPEVVTRNRGEDTTQTCQGSVQCP